MRLGIKIALSLTGVVALALAFACLLYYVQYETMFTSLQTSRMGVLATSIRNTVQSGTNLGLPLKDMRDIQGVIERAHALEDDIVSITVFDRSGTVLFDTDPSRIGPIPTGQTKTWAVASVKSGGRWDMPDTEAALENGIAVAGTAIINSFDAVLGGVALRFSRADLFAGLKGAALTLGKTTALILVTVAVVMVLAVHHLLRPLTRVATSMEQHLPRLASDGNVKAPNNTAITAPTELERELSAFGQRARTALTALDMTDKSATTKKTGG